MKAHRLLEQLQDVVAAGFGDLDVICSMNAFESTDVEGCVVVECERERVVEIGDASIGPYGKPLLTIFPPAVNEQQAAR